MDGIVNAGVNKIDNIEFKSSKFSTLQSDARKLAVKDAKNKAEDFVYVLGQKVGKAITITDNSQGYAPQPRYAMMKALSVMSNDESTPKDTLAIGEIEIVVNVSVSFILD